MSDLGPVTSTHKGRIAAGGIIWYCAGLVCLFSAWAIVSAPFSGAWDRALSGVGGVAVASLFLLYAYSRYAQTLTVHQLGFVWKPFLRAPVTVRWDEIQSVHIETWRGGRTLHTKGEHTEIELRLRDGSTVVLTNDIDRVDDIRGYLRGPQPAASAAPQAASSPWGPPPS